MSVKTFVLVISESELHNLQDALTLTIARSPEVEAVMPTPETARAISQWTTQFENLLKRVNDLACGELSKEEGKS